MEIIKTTSAERKAKILAVIEGCGWCSCSLYWEEAKELRAEGKIKQDEHYSVGGNRVVVWVGA